MVRRPARPAVAVLLACGPSVAAAPVSAVAVKDHWTGTDGYTVSGAFAFAERLALPGALDETDPERLIFTVTLDGKPLGTVVLGLGEIQTFNLDLEKGQFPVGRPSGSAFRKLRNSEGTPVGFESGDDGQAITVGGQPFGFLDVSRGLPPSPPSACPIRRRRSRSRRARSSFCRGRRRRADPGAPTDCAGARPGLTRPFRRMRHLAAACPGLG